MHPRPTLLALGLCWLSFGCSSASSSSKATDGGGAGGGSSGGSSSSGASSSSSGASTSSSGGASSGSSGGSSGTSEGGTGDAAAATPYVVASGQDTIIDMVSDGTNVYWIAQGGPNNDYTNPTCSIVKAPVGGGGTPTTLASQVTAIALTVQGANVYYVGQQTGASSLGQGIVVSIPTAAGGTATTLATQSGTWSDIASNASGVFMVDGTGLHVDSIPFSTGKLATVYTGSGSGNYQVVAVDSTDVYWLDVGVTNTDIKKVAQVGAATDTTIESATQATYFTVDATSVYWVNQGATAATIQKALLTGGTVTTLVSNPSGSTIENEPVNGPAGIAVDAQNVYWANAGNGYVLSAPLAGGPPVTLAQGTLLAAMTTDSTDVFWANGGSGTGATAVSQGVVVGIAK
jgi:hypothetical protein